MQNPIYNALSSAISAAKEGNRLRMDFFLGKYIDASCDIGRHVSGAAEKYVHHVYRTEGLPLMLNQYLKGAKTAVERRDWPSLGYYLNLFTSASEKLGVPYRNEVAKILEMWHAPETAKSIDDAVGGNGALALAGSSTNGGNSH